MKFINTLFSFFVLLVVLVAASVQTQPVQATTGKAYIRVNQVGYSSNEPKRAYLLTNNPVSTDAVFNVLKAGKSVFKAKIGASRGKWSDALKYVYPLDFNAVTEPGIYVIGVSSPVSTKSLSFKIDSNAKLYSKLLSNALFFFQTQRDGPTVVSSVMKRQPSHLNDRAATVYKAPKYDEDDVLVGDLVPVAGEHRRDVRGGWFDAGDYIKGVMTASYTEGLLLTAVRDYPQLVGRGARASFFAESKYGARFLMKMWDDKTKTLYYQVGIGNGNDTIVADHDLWRLPEKDDTYGGTDPTTRYIRNRPVLRAGLPGSSVSPNLAGRMAAVFALCYQNFKSTDPEFANQCLSSAIHIFEMANTNPHGNLVTFSPFSYYSETEWRDDLEWGAAELYFALAGADNLPSGLPSIDPLYYLQKSAYWANQYIKNAPDKDTLNVYDVGMHAHYELHRAITHAGNPKGLAVTQGALLNDMKALINIHANLSGTDPFEYAFPHAAFDAVTHVQGLIIVASEYNELSKSSFYARLIRRQTAYLFGANAWGVSFIVGAGTVYPKCMQHQIANLNGSLDGKPPIVYGAPVNGPNSDGELFEGLEVPENARACPSDGKDIYNTFTGHGARYVDSVAAWPSNEPAIDFAASTPLAFARLISAVSP